MKNTHQILSSLKSTPELSKLKNMECIKKLQTLFTLPLQRMIHYGYVKNRTLYFVLNHSGAKQEFDNTVASIKDALKLMATRCDNIEFDNIKAYAVTKKLHSFVPSISPQLTYHEFSEAKFVNNQENRELYDSFERIRKIIESRKKQNEP